MGLFPVFGCTVKLSFFKTIFCIALLSLFSQSFASECKLRGKVIKVADGDTITVLDSKKKQYKVRLAGIDAPEKGQPFGKKAKKYLSALVYKKAVCVDWYKKDKYRRLVAKVLVNNTDINYKIINKGLAWHYKKYQKEQSVSDRKKYSSAETDAKLAVIGLWSEPDAIPPWKWRNGVRPKKISKQQKRKIIQKKRLAKAPKPGFTCEGKRFCKHMNSCSEAYFYLNNCGLRRLDRDRDGIPCESICR